MATSAVEAALYERICKEHNVPLGTVFCKVPECRPLFNNEDYYALLGGKHPTCVEHAEARGWNRPRIAKEYPWLKFRRPMTSSTDRGLTWQEPMDTQ